MAQEPVGTVPLPQIGTINGSTQLGNNNTQNITINNQAPSVPIDRATLESIVKEVANTRADSEHWDPPAPGIELLIMLTITSPIGGQDNFIFDAEDSNHTRVSLYLTPDRTLVFRVQAGNDSVKIPVTPGLGNFIFGNMMLVTCAYGSTPAHSFLRMMINGAQGDRYRRQVPPMRPFVFEGARLVQGADIDHNNNGRVSIGAMVASRDMTASLDDEMKGLGVSDLLFGSKPSISSFIMVQYSGAHESYYETRLSGPRDR